jgi:D-alanyl-D-alanine carboxypeptidase
VTRKLLPILLLAVILFSAACTPPVVEPDPALTGLARLLQARLDDVRVESGFPGATLAVVLADGRQVHLATGLSDPEGTAPMVPEDRMFSGSTGKTFAAAVAMQLVDEGRLDLDQPLTDFFGGTPWLARLPNHDEITVRMLLSHTSGLPRYVMKPEFWNDLAAEPDRVWQPEELLSYIFDDPAEHPAGRGWAYSDTNFIIVGMIIEQITGSTVYGEVERRFTRPLGLTRTTPSTSRTLEGLVQGCSGPSPMYDLPARPLRDGVCFVNPQFEWTGGGFVTNSLDLALWLRELVDGDLLSEASKQAMREPADEQVLLAEGESYGLGLQIWASASGPIYGHGGIFPGHQTQIEFSSAHRFSLALQINADRFSGLLDRSMHEYAGQFMPQVEAWVREQAN